MSSILDSGNRRKFESGAVRDIADGKGRMDLVPLDVVADLCTYIDRESNVSNTTDFDTSLMLRNIDCFVNSGDAHFIFYLLWSFIDTFYDGDVFSAILELSVHYEEGAVKYKERNWEMGIPCHCYIDSALRHGIKLLRGDTDERHDRAFMWNLLGLLWTIRHKTEFNDLKFTSTERSKISKHYSRELDYSDILAELIEEDEFRFKKK